MRVLLFEKLEELNEYLKDKHLKNVDVKYQSAVVGERTNAKLERVYEIVDRFLVLED